MKAAIITERMDVTLGGAERSVSEMAKGLGENGVEVHILAANGQSTSENVHILCDNKQAKRCPFPTFTKAIKKHLEQNHYDIVHSVVPFEAADIYQPRGGSYIEAARRNADSYSGQLLRCYKKLTAFGNLRRSCLLHAEKKLCAKQNGPVVAALSEYVRQQFKQHYKLDDKRLIVIANGVETDKPTNTEAMGKLKTRIFAEAGIRQTEQPIFFLFAANNFRLKGLGVLIEALHRAKAENVYLVAAGKGRKYKYHRLAEKLGVSDKVIFVGGVGNIQDALAIADVAILPTFYDPASRFILEALAVNKPVITTRFNGAVDLFVNNRHGIVIDNPENVLALTQAITYFSSRENIQKASKAIAADNLEEKISINRVVKELIAVYESIMKDK